VKYIVTFYDVSGSLRTEQILKKLSYPCIVDAAPRSPGASCVYIIRTEARGPEEIKNILDEAGIAWKAVREDEAPAGP
jgi:hypothetical protein